MCGVVQAQSGGGWLLASLEVLRRPANPVLISAWLDDSSRLASGLWAGPGVLRCDCPSADSIHRLSAWEEGTGYTRYSGLTRIEARPAPRALSPAEPRTPASAGHPSDRTPTHLRCAEAHPDRFHRAGGKTVCRTSHSTSAR